MIFFQEFALWLRISSLHRRKERLGFKTTVESGKLENEEKNT
jgi:hypothetical protein